MALYFRGRLLFSLRASKGWTIDELAKSTGLNRRTIMNLEQNKFVRRPRGATIKKIADVFGVSEIQFIGGGER